MTLDGVLVLCVLQCGTEGDDTIFGTPGDDCIFGFGGKDTIYGMCKSGGERNKAWRALHCNKNV